MNHGQLPYPPDMVIRQTDAAEVVAIKKAYNALLEVLRYNQKLDLAVESANDEPMEPVVSSGGDTALYPNPHAHAMPHDHEVTDPKHTHTGTTDSHEHGMDHVHSVVIPCYGTFYTSGPLTNDVDHGSKTTTDGATAAFTTASAETGISIAAEGGDTSLVELYIDND